MSSLPKRKGNIPRSNFNIQKMCLNQLPKWDHLNFSNFLEEGRQWNEKIHYTKCSIHWLHYLYCTTSRDLSVIKKSYCVSSLLGWKMKLMRIDLWNPCHSGHPYPYVHFCPIRNTISCCNTPRNFLILYNILRKLKT